MADNEKAEAYVSILSQEDALAYRTNYNAHKTGINREAVKNYYSKWAPKYEEDLCPGRYNGPIIAGKSLANLYTKDRQTIKILDVAAGTGYLGMELVKYGFQEIHALDPSEGMLEVAKLKDVYTKFFCEFMGEYQLPINDDYYDAVVSAGGMGEGHIPCAAMREMARIVKSGGYVCLVMNEEYLKDVKEYANLQPMMKAMEREGLWKMVKCTTEPSFYFNKPGVVFVFEIY